MSKTRPTRPDVEHADLVDGLPPLVPIELVAKHLHVTVRTVRSWLASGRLPRGIRTARGGSGRRLIPRGDLARFIAGQVEEEPLAPTTRRAADGQFEKGEARAPAPRPGV